MIIDNIKNASEYFTLGSNIQSALNYLSVTDFNLVDPGRYEIEGNRIFAIIETYQPKRQEEGFWEAHIKHIDVQFMVSGEERIGYAPTTSMSAEPYNEEKDFFRLKGQGDFVTLRAGHFAILKPQDAHMPGIATQNIQQVKKVVVKVKI